MACHHFNWNTMCNPGEPCPPNVAHHREYFFFVASSKTLAAVYRRYRWCARFQCRRGRDIQSSLVDHLTTIKDEDVDCGCGCNPWWPPVFFLSPFTSFALKFWVNGLCTSRANGSSRGTGVKQEVKKNTTHCEKNKRPSESGRDVACSET